MKIFGIPFRKRDEDIFQVNYKKYYKIVYRHLYYLTGNNRLAEDLTQEVFIKFYNSEYEKIEYPGAWLTKVATNTAFNFLRGEKRRLKREESEIIDETNELYTLEDNVIRTEEIRNVRKVLSKLTEDQRVCLILKFSGYSYDEIHKSTGISKNNISQLIARGKQRFLTLYEKEGESDVLHTGNTSASYR